MAARLLRPCQVFPVGDDELQLIREAYHNGAYKISTTHETFSYTTHAEFLSDNKDSIAALKDARNGDVQCGMHALG